MNQTYRDYLTGLYTRQELQRFYENMAPDSRFHFMFMDVDNFKNVNDVYGHNEGDNLLKAVAVILKTCAPDAHIIRLGGDEFVLLLGAEHTRESLEQISFNINNKLSNKEGFEHISTCISASIGILLDQSSNDTLNDILLRSDMAMYYAKSHGKGNYIIFNDIAEQVFMELEMERRQDEALLNEEFEIRLLPIISAQTSKLMLSQVHLYWNMPDGRTLDQDSFLPLFEKNGFIRPLSMWVIRSSLMFLNMYHQIARQKGNIRIRRIGIRISRLMLLDQEFPNQLEALLKEYNIAPDELDLEVDENAFERGSDAMLHTLAALKDKGFCVSLIGVGSDFKSLIYWDKIHFDNIMFHQQYVRNALSTSRGRQIIKTLLLMSHELKMYTIADGINSQEDALYLSRCGCNAISGNYCSPPLPLQDYSRFIADKISQRDEKIEFHLLNNLVSADKKYKGKIIGRNIQYTKGISSNWGGILFPGGSNNENVMELPGEILSEASYTICFWLKPLEQSSWTSALYARYQGGFSSFCPHVVGGNSIFRIYEDNDVYGFHDAFFRQIPLYSWSFVCLTYDALSEISRAYINGRKTGFLADTPSLTACRQILLGGDPFQPSYRGYISGLIFFREVKSDDEIQEIYRNFCEEPDFCGSMEDFWME